MTQVNSADTDQTTHNVASAHGLHCLRTKYYIKLPIKMKNVTQLTLKRKKTGPIDKSGKFYSV